MKKVSILGILVLLMVLGLNSCVFSNSDTSSIKTEHAWIWGQAQVPEYLPENFDRIFIRLGRFFRVDVNDERVLVFVVDFETLQKLYHKHKGNPKAVAAFYDSKWNRIYFSPRYINEYYITYELINYFMNVHRERTVRALARFLVLQGLREKSIVKEFILKDVWIEKE